MSYDHHQISIEESSLTDTASRRHPNDFNSSSKALPIIEDPPMKIEESGGLNFRPDHL